MMDVERHIAVGNRVNGASAALKRRRNVSTAALVASVLLYEKVSSKSRRGRCKKLRKKYEEPLEARSRVDDEAK